MNFSPSYNFAGVYCGQVGAIGRIVRGWFDVKNSRSGNVGRSEGCRLKVGRGTDGELGAAGIWRSPQSTKDKM